MRARRGKTVGKETKSSFIVKGHYYANRDANGDVVFLPPLIDENTVIKPM